MLGLSPSLPCKGPVFAPCNFFATANKNLSQSDERRMEVFFLFGIVIASRHYFATSDFSQSHERNGKCFPALDKKARFCSFSFPQYLPWTPGEAWANHVKAVNCAMKAISCFPHSSLTQRKVIFLHFVNLDMIFSFFGSS